MAFAPFRRWSFECPLTKGQIVDSFDKPIARLYEGGELGSILGFLYGGPGWNICEVVVSGQIAGKNAAAEKSWEAAS